jgi:hypothetical protein
MSDILLPSFSEQSIVVVGSLNPAIFHPSWFAANELVRPSDVQIDAMKILVSSDVTVFTASWFDLRAMQRRLSLHTNDPRMDLPLRDLMRGTFECLEHTPVAAFGFNCDQVYSFDTDEEAARLTDLLSPKSAWDQFLQSTSVQRVIVAGVHDGHIVKFRVDTDDNVVKLSVNQHYEIPAEVRDNSGEITSARFLIQTLMSDWEAFLEYVRTTSQQLVTHAAGRE